VVRRQVARGAASGEFLARRPFTHPNLCSVTLRAMRTWERDDPDLGRPIAAPLDRHTAAVAGADHAGRQDRPHPRLHQPGHRPPSSRAAHRPVRGSPLDNLAEVNMTDLHGLVLAGNLCCAGTPWLRRIPLTLYRRRSGPPDRRGFGLIGVLPPNDPVSSLDISRGSSKMPADLG
jgi:hypothetical protein